jgi:hypothetical protein
VTATLATAADARYGAWLLNMLGSVQRRSPLFDRIVAYDLGLTRFQRRLLEGVEGVEVRSVPPSVPHWRQGYTWKAWAFRHVEGDAIVWLDAGATVLRPLTEPLAQIRERGYFVVSQDVRLGECIPSDYYALYGLDPSVGERDCVAAGIIGFARESEFYERVVIPTYEDALAGRTLGFSPSEAERLNRGFGRLDTLILRDAPRFRHDQTVLNIHLYKTFADPHVNDLAKFGGWTSPRDHPAQVIWNHRRRGDYRFLPRVRYRGPVALVGLPWGAWRFLAANRGWLLHPAFASRLAGRLVRRS